VQDCRKLAVWHKAHALATRIKHLTDDIRRDNTGVTTQLRRASLSIASNIAEGCGRATDRDFARFVQVAIGSASEVEYQLNYASDGEILNRRDVEELVPQVIEVRRMLYGLLKRLREPPRNDREKDGGDNPP
jgi:four helix bundle protein